MTKPQITLDTIEKVCNTCIHGSVCGYTIPALRALQRFNHVFGTETPLKMFIICNGFKATGKLDTK